MPLDLSTAARAALRARSARAAPLALCAVLACAACGSLRKLAVSQVGDALARCGEAWSSDADAELIREAAPLSLKLLESLLAENPRHVGLCQAASSGFTQYAYAFVEQDADFAEARDLALAESLRDRACKLYLRGRNYGLQGLEVGHPGLGAALRARGEEALAEVGRDEVPLLFWTAAGWGSAISLSN